MKKIASLAALGLIAAVASFNASAAVDVVEYNTGYFQDPSQSVNIYSPYYRGHAGDWEWAHNAITGSFSSATLNISAWDVDYIQGERDIIYALDSGTWVNLGYLGGGNNSWSYTTFNLGSNFFDDIEAGLQVKIDIDSTLSGWAVALAKSAISTDKDALPSPNPTVAAPVPEPETYAMLLAGLGLLGFTAKRRKQNA